MMRTLESSENHSPILTGTRMDRPYEVWSGITDKIVVETCDIVIVKLWTEQGQTVLSASMAKSGPHHGRDR